MIKPKPWFEIECEGSEIHVHRTRDIADFEHISDRERLLMSIEKFEALLQTVKEHKTSATWFNGADTCPLCWKYHYFLSRTDRAFKTNCDGCPIYADTGEVSCRGTPYYSIVSITTYKDSITNIKREIAYLKKVLRQTK